MNALQRMEKSDAIGWWEKRRKLYNVALVFAGLGAFACYAAVLDQVRTRSVPLGGASIPRTHSGGATSPQ
jgi:hypothetical protein